MPQVAKMEVLDDDCLRHILGLLRLRDQISALRSWSRFRHILCDMWRMQYKRLDLDFYFEKGPLTRNEIWHFIAYVHPTVEVVRLEHIPRYIFEILRKYKFLNTHELYISTRSPDILRTPDIVTLKETFPNLRTFRPCGSFSGEYFRLWKQMEHLTLTSCFDFEWQFLTEIIRELPLKTLMLNNFQYWLCPLPDEVWLGNRLETLILNSCELQILLPDHIRFLRHLKELQISDEYSQRNLEDLRHALVRYKADNVVGVRTRNVSAILPAAVDLCFHANLQSLSFFCDPVAFSEVVEYVQQLEALRVLKFFSCRVRTQVDFRNLFEHAAQLDLISFETCGIDVENLSLDVEKVMACRSKPLTLNFCNNWLGSCCDVKVELILVESSSLFTLTKEGSTEPRCRFLTYQFS